MKKNMITAILMVGGLISGCAGGSAVGFDSGNFSNAAQVHIFTSEEQNGMTAEGTIPTMLAPSEIRGWSETEGPPFRSSGVSQKE